MPISKKQWIVGGSLGAVALVGAWAATAPQKPEILELQSEIQSEIALTNQQFAKQHIPAEVSLIQLDDVDSTSATAVVRITYVDPVEGVKRTSCVDLTTDMTFHSILSSAPLTTVTTIVSDPDQSDCRWIDSLMTDPKAKAFFENELNGQVPVKLTSEVSASGDIHGKITTEALELSEDDLGKDGTLAFRPMEIVLDIPASKSAYGYTLTWPGMRFEGVKKTNNSVMFDIGAVNASGELTKVTDNIWTGPGKVSVSSIQFSDKNGAQYQADDFSLAVLTEEEQGKLSQSTTIKVGGMSKDSHSVGSLTYSQKFSHLDVNALEELLTIAQEFETVKDPNNFGPLMERFTQAVATSFSGAEVSMPVQYQLGDGNLNLDLALHVEDLSGIDPFAVQQNPMLFLSRLRGELTGSFNDSLVDAIIAHPLVPEANREKMRQNLTMGMQQAGKMGAIIDENDHHLTKVVWDTKQLLLNDKPVDPAVMQALSKGR